MADDLPNMASFWAQVDAWRSSHGNWSLSDKTKFATQERLWQERGHLYMRGKGSMEKDLVYQTQAQREASAAILAAGLNDVDSGIVRAFDSVVGAHAVKTFDAWPVASGVSKAALGLTVESSDHAYKATLASAAPYVIYIRGPGFRRSTTTRITPEKRPPKEGDQIRLKGRDGAWLVYHGEKWSFEQRETAAERTGNPDAKPAEGVPFQDYLAKPARRLAEETASRSVDNITAKKGA